MSEDLSKKEDVEDIEKVIKDLERRRIGKTSAKNKGYDR